MTWFCAWNFGLSLHKSFLKGQVESTSEIHILFSQKIHSFLFNNLTWGGQGVKKYYESKVKKLKQIVSVTL